MNIGRHLVADTTPSAWSIFPVITDGNTKTRTDKYSRLPDGLSEVLAANAGRVDGRPLLLHLNPLQHAAVDGERTGNKAQQDYQGPHGRWC